MVSSYLPRVYTRQSAAGYVLRDNTTRRRRFDTKLTPTTCDLVVGNGQVHPKCMASLVALGKTANLTHRAGCYSSFLKVPGYELVPETLLALLLPKNRAGCLLGAGTCLCRHTNHGPHDLRRAELLLHGGKP